ncbi:MAG TPA: hypothetical protein VNS63_06395, partial [Blastocatellia bacterium]|nr:hypothetical protein [Blastocatellia bacterium]
MKLIVNTGYLAVMGLLLCGCSASAAELAASGRTTNAPTKFAIDARDHVPGGDKLRSLSDTVNALKQIHTHDETIPPAAKPLLTTLKHQLRDLICDFLASEGSDVSAQQIEAATIVDLRRAGLAVSDPRCVVVDEHFVDDGFDYGAIYSVTLKRIDLCFVDLIAVTTTIGVCCGEDTSLYLFKRDGEQWRLCLQQESNNYDNVSGAQGRFQFDVSFPDQQGNFFVLVANVNPWCTSNWQSLRYAVLRPGPMPDEPRVILAEEHLIFLDDGPSFRLITRTEGFRIAFHDESFMDLSNEGIEVDWDDPNSERMMEYAVQDDRVKLVSDRA